MAFRYFFAMLDQLELAEVLIQLSKLMHLPMVSPLSRLHIQLEFQSLQGSSLFMIHQFINQLLLRQFAEVIKLLPKEQHYFELHSQVMFQVLFIKELLVMELALFLA